jgi:hypothetical protein
MRGGGCGEDERGFEVFVVSAEGLMGLLELARGFEAYSGLGNGC